MLRPPIQKEVEGHFYGCRFCNYQGGFHVTFNSTETPKTFTIILVCPKCERTYDIDWKIKTE
jgi:hypothetical protein